MAVFTRMLVSSPALARSYRVLHLDTSDRRSLDNMGRLDARNVALALRHARALDALLRRERPQVVYIELSQNALAFLRDAVLVLVARLHGCAVAAHLHGSDFQAFYRRSSLPVRWLVRRTTASLAAAAVLGAGLRAQFQGLLPDERVLVAPAGLPDPGESRPSGARPVVTVTYLGMLFRPKGILDLLAAAAALSPAEPALKFVLAGEWFSGADRQEVEAFLLAHDLSDRVVFTGAVDGSAKATLWSETDILVFPGYQPEGLPLVILEAMSMGLPVVATRVGAVPDAIRDGVEGVLVPPRDRKALAAAIQRLARDPDLRRRLGAAGRARFRAEFTEDACIGGVVALLERAREVAAS